MFESKSKCVKGMSRSETPRRNSHTLLGGRYLEVSSASLFVNLRCVPVCIPPHSVTDRRTPLLFCLCFTEHHPKDATHRWWHCTSPEMSQDFKRRLGDSNAARGRDHKNRSAAVTTAQIRRHCQVVMWSPCRLKNYEDGYPGPL